MTANQMVVRWSNGGLNTGPLSDTHWNDTRHLNIKPFEYLTSRSWLFRKVHYLNVRYSDAHGIKKSKSIFLNFTWFTPVNSRMHHCSIYSVSIAEAFLWSNLTIWIWQRSCRDWHPFFLPVFSILNIVCACSLLHRFSLNYFTLVVCVFNVNFILFHFVKIVTNFTFWGNGLL